MQRVRNLHEGGWLDDAPSKLSATPIARCISESWSRRSDSAEIRSGDNIRVKGLLDWLWNWVERCTVCRDVLDIPGAGAV
jgi:hypothetical protein